MNDTPPDFFICRTDWLHSLSPDDLRLLREYRRQAREQFPAARNAMEAARAAAPPRVREMPRDYVASLDRGS